MYERKFILNTRDCTKRELRIGNLEVTVRHVDHDTTYLVYQLGEEVRSYLVCSPYEIECAYFLFFGLADYWDDTRNLRLHGLSRYMTRREGEYPVRMFVHCWSVSKSKLHISMEHLKWSDETYHKYHVELWRLCCDIKELSILGLNVGLALREKFGQPEYASWYDWSAFDRVSLED